VVRGVEVSLSVYTRVVVWVSVITPSGGVTISVAVVVGASLLTIFVLVLYTVVVL
jgi:hypothetical protein